MRIYWVSKYLIGIPIKLLDSDKHEVGELNSSRSKTFLKVNYQGKQFQIDYKDGPSLNNLAKPIELRVIDEKGSEQSSILNRQWLKDIEIKIQSGETFIMRPRGFPLGILYPYFEIILEDRKIGEFKENVIALSKRGYLDLDDSQSKNTALIVSVLYLGINDRILS